MSGSGVENRCPPSTGVTDDFGFDESDQWQGMEDEVSGCDDTDFFMKIAPAEVNVRSGTSIETNILNSNVSDHSDPNNKDDGSGARTDKGSGHDNGNGNASISGNNPLQGPDSTIMFADCGGLEAQISFLKKAVIETLSQAKNHNGLHQRFCLKPPKGILFHGAPGTGKTRLALALSNEISNVLRSPVHFIYRKGNDVASRWFGQSSKNLREIFDEAKRQKPSLVFFDELDGLSPNRDNPLLVEGSVTIVTTLLGLFDEVLNGEVFIVAATNRLDAIDPALKRPGRFDKVLEFRPPNEESRREILSIHTKHWHVKPTPDFLQWLGHETEGFSGADLAKLCSDAFDCALMRTIGDEATGFEEMSLDGFEVTVEDWKQKLATMKPTTSFTLSMYALPKEFSGENRLMPFIKQNVENLTKRLLKEVGSKYSEKLRCLYVWRNEENRLMTLEDLIISPVFRNSDNPLLKDIPKYAITIETLSSVPVREWNSKIAITIGQAIASNQQCIIVIPQIDLIAELIKNARVTIPVSMESHLEKLRGTKVTLLATGNRAPSQLQWYNPFRSLFESEKQTIEVKLNMNIETRKELFLPLFDNPVEHEYKIVLDFILYITENLDLGSMISLYDKINQIRTEFRTSNQSRYEELRALLKTISACGTVQQALDQSGDGGNNELGEAMNED